MERKELAREVARLQKLPISEAQDNVDDVVEHLIQKLNGSEATESSEIEALMSAPVVATKSPNKAQTVAKVRAAAARIAKSRLGVIRAKS